MKWLSYLFSIPIFGTFCIMCFRRSWMPSLYIQSFNDNTYTERHLFYLLYYDLEWSLLLKLSYLFWFLCNLWDISRNLSFSRFYETSILQHTYLGNVRKEERICLGKPGNIQKCKAVGSDLAIDVVCHKLLYNLLGYIKSSAMSFLKGTCIPNTGSQWELSSSSNPEHFHVPRFPLGLY